MADEYLIGLDAVQEEIRRIKYLFSPAEQRAIMTVTAQRTGIKAEAVALPSYPAPSGKPLALFYQRVSEASQPYRLPGGQIRRPGDPFRSKFKSRKQQGKVFALRKEGRIPYRRTGKLGQSITSKVMSVSESEAEIGIGTRMKYGPHVIDRNRQSHYHQGTWPTIQDNLEAGLPELERVAVATYVGEVERRVK